MIRPHHEPAGRGVRRGRVVRELDANIPIYNLRTMDHQMDQSLLNDRLIATLSTAFGVLATLLAVIGSTGDGVYRRPAHA